MAFVDPGPVYPPRTAHARIDARLILISLRATADWEGQRDAIAPVKPLRELIWACWELPRFRDVRDRRGGYLVRQKYPAWVPWSPSARRAHDRNERLSIEHVYPVRLVVRRLLDAPPANEAMLIRALSQLLRYAVVTPRDNEVLRSARVHHQMAPGSSDPWDRYRIAGLPLDRFRPLQPLAE